MEVYFRFPFLLHKNYTLDDSLLGLGIEEAQDMQPENTLHDILIILSWSHLQNRTCKKRLSLNSPFFAWRQILWKKFNCHKFLPGCFINQRRLTLITEEETRSKSASHSDKLCHKLFYHPSILLGAHLFFLKIIYSFLNCLHLPSLSSINMVYKSSNLTAFFGYSLFCLWCPCACNIKI